MTGTQFIQFLKSNNYTTNNDWKKIIRALQTDKKLLSLLLNAISPILESKNLKADDVKKLLTAKQVYYKDVDDQHLYSNDLVDMVVLLLSAT